MDLPSNVKIIISRLYENGHRADIVGGCVRDRLLGKEPNDYDITTDATPDEMREIFSDMRTIETGIKHGTLTVLLDGEPYEVTTYRVDGEYTDNRHPDSVSFTRALSEDLSRRDFTVNAMCFNDKDGLTDLFSGREDLKAGIIRAVGDPVRRFTEDALRILRALRFAATLDFHIEEHTSNAIFETANLLSAVSAERIYTEWKKLISGVGAYRIIKEYKEIIKRILPTVNEVSLPSEEQFLSASGDIRELSLFCDSDNPPADFYEAMTLLRTDSKHKNFGVKVLAHLSDKAETDTDLRLMLVNVGEECAIGVIKLKILLGLSDKTVLVRLKSILASGFCFRISDMKINGNDLTMLGIKGRKIGETLNALLIMIAKGEVENEKESLIKAVTK